MNGDDAVQRACHDLGSRILRGGASTPSPPVALQWASPWQGLVEYRCQDLEAEIGFFHGWLGFPLLLVEPHFCMVAAGDGSYPVAVKRADTQHPPTPADAVSLHFQVENLDEVTAALMREGISFHDPMRPYPGHPMRTAACRSPAGLTVRFWEPQKKDESLSGDSDARRR